MSGPVSAEMQAKIALWRQKAIEGTLTLEEQKEAIIALRADRRNAAVSSEASRRKKAKAEIKSADEMLDELKGI